MIKRPFQMVTLYYTLFNSDFSLIRTGLSPKWAKLATLSGTLVTGTRGSVGSWASWFAGQWPERPRRFPGAFRARIPSSPSLEALLPGMSDDFLISFKGDVLKRERWALPWELHPGDSGGIYPSGVSRVERCPVLCHVSVQWGRRKSSAQRSGDFVMVFALYGVGARWE